MDILIKATQFLLSLSILVVLHEMGHFLAAKYFGTRVEKFYLFFDWKFSLFKFKRGNTEYGIGWIPLGGYVKISGMIDESMDTDQMDSEPQSWEFRSKPAWQRLVILLGGVTVNFLLAMVIYTGIMFAWGEKYLPNENLTDGVWVVDSLAADMGFENGDKILSINGKTIERFSGIMPEMIYGGSVTVQNENGDSEDILVPENFIESLIDQENKQLFMFRMPFMISKVAEESENVNVGLKPKDMILSLNDIEVKYYDEFAEISKPFAGQEVDLKVMRNEKEMLFRVKISEEGKLGVFSQPLSLKDLAKMGYYELETHEYSFLESIPVGVNKALDQMSGYLRQLKLIFNPSTGAYKGVGGFAAIGNLFPPFWDWQIFWSMTAFLSIMLGVLNLLPIPALDGGHAMFTIYEMITGKKPNDKFMEYAQMIGIVLLLSLFVYANGMDLFKFLK